MEATAAYHADAVAMARMGYAPESEEWSTVFEHVLTVRYVFAPTRGPAVLAALHEIEAEALGTPPEPAPKPNILRRATGLAHGLPMELKLSVGGFAGTLVGLGLCLLVAVISGDTPDTISLFGFAVIGMVLGSVLGLVPE
jgi:hypothetical protein